MSENQDNQDNQQATAQPKSRKWERVSFPGGYGILFDDSDSEWWVIADDSETADPVLILVRAGKVIFDNK